MEFPDVKSIGERLNPFDGGCRFYPEWSELLRFHQERPSFGEIRASKDWKTIPVGQPVRVVYLVDNRGPVIRWLAAAEAADILGGSSHERLERGDGGGRARSGYLWRAADGTIQVR